MSIKKEAFFKYIIFTSRASMVFILSITLISFGIVIFSFFAAQKGINKWQEDRLPGKIIFMSEYAPNEFLRLGSFLDSLENKKVIKKIEYKTKEEGLQELVNDEIIDLKTIQMIKIGEIKNPLPNIKNIYFFTQYHNIDYLSWIENKINQFSCVAYFQKPIDITEINKYKSNIFLGSLILAILFFIISVLLIYNNIRLALYSNRINIKAMQLVGATKSFIQFPFIKKSIWIGFISGLIAVIFLCSSWYTCCYFFPYLNELINYNKIIQFCGVIVFLGILISFLSTFIVLRKLTSLQTDIYE